MISIFVFLKGCFVDVLVESSKDLAILSLTILRKQVSMKLRLCKIEQTRPIKNNIEKILLLNPISVLYTFPEFIVPNQNVSQALHKSYYDASLKLLNDFDLKNSELKYVAANYFAEVFKIKIN